MKCFFDLHEGAPHFADYAQMLKVAIVTLRKHTSLEPYVVYDGKANSLTAWLSERKVEVIAHRCLIYPELVRLGEATGDGVFLRHGPGVLLKLDLTEICAERGWEKETVLFCDCDLMFQGDPTAQWPDMNATFFAAGPEDDPHAADRLNTGVMLINVPAMLPYAAVFREYTARILPEAVKISWDQHAYRVFFRHGGWKSLSAELNWKPYWGVNASAKVIHFHGPKPFLRGQIAAGLAHPFHAPLVGAAFQHYCAEWDRMLAEADR